MDDLRFEVAGLFVGLETPEIRNEHGALISGYSVADRSRVRPETDDAARWLSSTPEEREAMRPAFDERLRATIKRLGAVRFTRDRREYQRLLMQRPDQRAKNIERCKARRKTMSQEERLKNAARAKAWRQARKKT